VRRFGKSFAHPLVVLIVSPNQLDQSRFGIIAGKSVGNAVYRNRAKRLLRAATQPLLTEIEPGFDILLIARKPLLETSFDALQKTLGRLVTRAGLRQK
jgi:ribonuclease P protein component